MARLSHGNTFSETQTMLRTAKIISNKLTTSIIKPLIDKAASLNLRFTPTV